jgi:hypothetical protein
MICSSKALWLLALFLASFGLKNGHLLLHGEHHRALPCSASREGDNTRHLHDERYSTHDCFVCAWGFSPVELSDAIPTLKSRLVAPSSSYLILWGKLTAAQAEQRYLRGPPLGKQP